MSQCAEGTFEVSVTRDPPYDSAEGIKLVRANGAKQFYGDLEGHGLVEMIQALTEVAGSAAYVAIERVYGVLHGRRGSFVLQHFGTMDRGKSTLEVHVVPDSGTGELLNLSGKMTITIVAPKHHYRFQYQIAEA